MIEGHSHETFTHVGVTSLRKTRITMKNKANLFTSALWGNTKKTMSIN